MRDAKDLGDYRYGLAKLNVIADPDLAPAVQGDNGD